VTTSVPQLGQSTKAEKPSNSSARFNEFILKMCFASQILMMQKLHNKELPNVHHAKQRKK
jgi:hypothetical protein